MTSYIVHIRRHCGWHTTTAEGETFGDAAITAAVETCKQFGLDLDRIPHTVEYIEEDVPDSVTGTFRSRRVRFRRASEQPVFDPFIAKGWTTTKPGDYWFSEPVREGKPGDCTSCGGSGTDFYNPFIQCWACGDRESRVV